MQPDDDMSTTLMGIEPNDAMSTTMKDSGDNMESSEDSMDMSSTMGKDSGDDPSDMSAVGSMGIIIAFLFGGVAYGLMD